MRSRATTLLVALILLTAAVPAVLDCCLHGPARGPQAAAHPLRPPLDNSARGCVDHSTPAQNPYIETSSGGGGAPAANRAAEGAHAASPARVVDSVSGAHGTVPAADGTGPPLWLATCVSRT